VPLACFVLTRRFVSEDKWGWALYSALSGILFLIMFFVTGSGFNQTEGLVDIAGLLQRVTVIIGFAWLTAIAMHLLRHDRAAATPQ
jgi:hypothetical protein